MTGWIWTHQRTVPWLNAAFIFTGPMLASQGQLVVPVDCWERTSRVAGLRDLRFASHSRLPATLQLSFAPVAARSWPFKVRADLLLRRALRKRKRSCCCGVLGRPVWRLSWTEVDALNLLWSHWITDFDTSRRFETLPLSRWARALPLCSSVNPCLKGNVKWHKNKPLLMFYCPRGANYD